ncbi:MAG: carbonic anhydrase [Nodosilinea sp.]
MDRRQVLRLLGLCSVGATTILGRSSFSRAVANELGPMWGYVGVGNPAEWSELSPEFSACGVGREQSPIDLSQDILSQDIRAELSTITINYQSVPLRIVNNGHTAEVRVNPGSGIILDNEPYELEQFHFHQPSEHTVEGTTFPMEMHLVHKNARGELAVIGVLLAEGKENPTLGPIWEAIPPEKSEEVHVPDVQINLDALLPENSETYRYFGSLTTPPCSEIVQWVVLQTPMELSPAQVAQFKAIFPPNARPVQARNRRIVLRSD